MLPLYTYITQHLFEPKTLAASGCYERITNLLCTLQCLSNIRCHYRSKSNFQFPLLELLLSMHVCIYMYVCTQQRVYTSMYVLTATTMTMPQECNFEMRTNTYQLLLKIRAANKLCKLVCHVQFVTYYCICRSLYFLISTTRQEISRKILRKKKS